MSLRQMWAAPVLLAAGLALAACGSDARKTETGRVATGEVKQLFAGLIGRKAAQPPAPDAETIAREALAANAGPLILASFESTGGTSVLGMRGENGTMRTWFTPGAQALILRSGIVAGTRGFGFDMTSAETEALSALVSTRTAGTAPMVLRYLDGLGKERPLPLTCTVTPASATSYDFAGQTWAGTLVGAQCEGLGYSTNPSFIVADSGEIISSRQWIGPQVGYVTLQVLRP